MAKLQKKQKEYQRLKNDLRFFSKILKRGRNVQFQIIENAERSLRFACSTKLFSKIYIIFA